MICGGWGRRYWMNWTPMWLLPSTVSSAEDHNINIFVAHSRLFDRIQWLRLRWEIEGDDVRVQQMLLVDRLRLSYRGMHGCSCTASKYLWVSSKYWPVQLLAREEVVAAKRTKLNWGTFLVNWFWIILTNLEGNRVLPSFFTKKLLFSHTTDKENFEKGGYLSVGCWLRER